MGRWITLILYAVAIFISLPYTPRAVGWARERFGAEALIAGVGVGLALAGLVLLRRLLRTPALWPRAHLALGALAAAAGAAWQLLASSPIGRIHIPEYALLAVLAARVLGGTTAGAIGGGAAAAGFGFLDEMVQGVTPGRVFDWWDVALNAVAALLGGLACAWWRWTGNHQEVESGAKRRAAL